MITLPKIHKQEIARKEAQINREKKKLAVSMNEDIERLDKLAKILGNGITLQIFIGTRKNHA